MGLSVQGVSRDMNQRGVPGIFRVKEATHQDISRPLREIKPIPPTTGHFRVVPDFEPPEGTTNTYVKPSGRTAPPPHLMQTWHGSERMPGAIKNFEGVGAGLSGYTVRVIPPDTQGDVGPDYYIQWINDDFAVFDKATSAVVYGPAAGNTLWSGFGGLCENRNDGDPIAKYDRIAGRWVMTQFAVNSASGEYAECIAVSETDDPMGRYYRYSYSFNAFNDYPKLAVWPDGYYISYNMFSGGSYQGAMICAYDRAAMLTGSPASAQCTPVNSSYFSYLPSDLDGFSLPPTGAPNYVMAIGTNQLLFWTLHIDWATPTNSTFSGPTPLTVTSFSNECAGYTRGQCIQQLGSSSVTLESLGDRAMYRLPYRNFGDHESLVLNHSINSGSQISGIRWYEIRNPGTTPTIYQSGTYAPDAHSRWMGSIAMDKMGNIAVGYSVSDSSMHPSIWYVGRLASDPLNQLPQAESVLLNGNGSQTTYHRWGDYSSMSLDPVDDCTFWYTQEYHSTDGYLWHTRIGAFKYNMGAAPTGLSATPSGNNAVALSWSAASGATGYAVYRAEKSGGPYDRLAETAAGTTSYLDTNLQGGITLYYVVTAFYGGACDSYNSTEVSATPTGPCDLAPTFGGISSARANGCAIDLSWSAATAQCAGPVEYCIYRSTTSGFTPSSANRIAAALTGTSYTDRSNITVGTISYYIVRATDRSNGQEDTNTTEKAGTTWANTTTTVLNEVFSTGDPPTGWSLVNRGTGTQRWTTTNPGGRSVPSGITTPFEIIDSDYDGSGKSQDDSLITPTFNAAGATTVTLSFDTYYRDYDGNDSALIDVSSDGGTTWTNVSKWTSSVGTSSSASHQSINISSVAAGSSQVKIRFHYLGVWGYYWFIDNVTVSVTAVACSSTPSIPPGVMYLTTRSTSGQVKLEWVNPSSGYGSTRICSDTTSYPTNPTACTTLVVDRAGGAGAYDSFTDTGLANGAKIYYTAFVNNGSGVFSGGVDAWAYPFATTGKVKWSYSSAASSLAPAGVRPGPIGGGGTWAVSNDRMLHGMNPTTSGGDWPRTPPYSWVPMAMNGPSQSRPPVVPTTAVSGANEVIFLGSEEGLVYAADAITGARLWRSPSLGSMLLASPSGIFTDLGGAWNLLFVGSRDAVSDNTMYMLNPADGSIITSFDNGGGTGGIGIISSVAAVDYTNHRLYFSSRRRSGGSSDTLWCLSFNGTTLSKLWSAALGDIDGAPVLYQGRLYIGNTSGTVYALNPATGSSYWSYSASGDGPVKGFVLPEATTNPPRKLYFSTTTKIWAITDNTSSASIAWSTTAVPGPTCPLAPLGSSVLYVGASDGRLYQLKTSTGTVDTSVQLGDGTAAIGNPVFDVVNNMVYVGSEAGAVYGVVVPLQ